MYKKIILFLTIISLTSSVLAYQGKGFRIISERVKSSAKFNGSFESVSKEDFSKAMFASANASVYNVNGHPYEYIEIKGFHSVNINNYTSQRQRYSYAYNLKCADMWVTFERELELDPNGNFSDSSISRGTFQATGSGSFSIYANTDIAGAEIAHYVAQAIASIR
jgi:hypothetical protein